MSSKAAATTAGETTDDITRGKEPPKWRAAVDFKYIRDNAEAVQANADVRKAQVDVARVVTLYDEWLVVKSSADDLRAARNASAAKMKGKLEQAQRDVRPPLCFTTSTANPCVGLHLPTLLPAGGSEGDLQRRVSCARVG